MTAPPPDPRSRATPPRRQPRTPWSSSLALFVVPLILLVATFAFGGWWIVSTTTGLRTALALSGPLAGIRVETTGLQGSLRAGFRATTANVNGATWSLSAADLAVEPRAFDLAQRLVHLERVSAAQLSVAWKAGEKKEPARPPGDLALPFELVVDAARIDRIKLVPPAAPEIEITGFELAGRANAGEIVIEQLRLTSGPTQATMQGKVQAQRPFALSAQAQLTSTLQQRGVAGQLTASGTLADVRLAFNATAEDAHARGTVQLQPFAPVPLVRLQADVRDFELDPWIANVPKVRLNGEVDLRPIDSAAGLSVAGPFSVRNEIAGPIDQQRLPVRTVQGTLSWQNERLAVALAELGLTRGRAAGRLEWTRATGLDATLQFSGLDASSIHTRAQATNANGTLRYTLREGRQQFVGTAANAGSPPIAADFDLTLADKVLRIVTARLRLGAGRAELAGHVELQGGYQAQLAGTFSALDLEDLVRGLDTRLNGTIEVDGRLQPALDGRARLELSDSRLAGRPVQGRAQVRMADAVVDVDVDIASASARLRADGGLGAGRELKFTLAAPQIAEVVPAINGALEASGTVSGPLDRPMLQATFAARDLAFENGHRITSVAGTVSGGTAADAPLALDARVTGHINPSGPQLSVAELTLAGRGTTRRHTLEFAGATVAGEPLAANLSGGWIDNGWQGALVSARVGAPLELIVSEAVPVRWSTSDTAIGPAQFQLRATTFTAVNVQRDSGRWRTEGNFSGFQPQGFDPRTRAPRRAVRTTAADRTPLTLAGRWQLDVGESVTGIAVIERTAGDLYAGLGALTPIGISDVGIALNILNNRATGNAYLRGKSLGSIDALIDAWVEPMAGVGVRLAQTRPLRVDIDASLPDLSWVSPLVGDNVQFGGAAQARVRVSGTPEDPTASGTIAGTGLHLSSVELGVRLENGMIDAVLDEGVLVVNQMTFAGAPRGRPDERRAAADVDLTMPGRLHGVGRIALRSLTGSFGVEAENLPVLQRSDRWLVVSGRGGVTLTPKRVDITADLRADGAYVNFDALRGPRQLPADVVVVRAPEDLKKPAAAPVAVNLQVNGDLGPRFYIKGAGLEARLAGTVKVVGRPGGFLLAQGSVQTVDGQYSGYGQRLQIERGIVTFQGALDNPALNVLAIRSGLPVEVGVEVVGSALQPLVRLHSSPSMPDIEKLNWLVLGRPLGGDTGQERALLTAAASALFAGRTDGAGGNVLSSLGIDDISLRPGHGASSLMPRETVAGTLRTGSATVPSEVVAIGKRITDDLYLSFEQAISGAEYYVALNYQISQRLSLVARAGSVSALDLVYAFAFD